MGSEKNWVVGVEVMGAEGGAEEASEFKRRVALGRGFHGLPWVSPTPPHTGTASYMLHDWPGNPAQPLDPSTQCWNLLPGSAAAALSAPCVSAASVLVSARLFPSCARQRRTLVHLLVNPDLLDSS